MSVFRSKPTMLPETYILFSIFSLLVLIIAVIPIVVVSIVVVPIVVLVGSHVRKT